VNAAAALATIRHMQSALGKHTRKVRIHIDPASGFWLTAATAISLPIPAEFTVFRPSTVLVGSINVDHLARLFSATTSDAVEFRVALAPPGGNRVEPAFFFRTVDTFVVTEAGAALAGIDAAKEIRGTVTRYAPGIDR